jgi:hypothetical protein
VRAGQLQDQARDPGAAPDVQERGCGFRDGGEKHQRLHHEVAYALGAIPVGGEAADLLPAF